MSQEQEPLTAEDAAYLLGALDRLAYSIDQNVSGDDSDDVHPELWDDYGAALDVLRDYGLRPPRQF